MHNEFVFPISLSLHSIVFDVSSACHSTAFYKKIAFLFKFFLNCLNAIGTARKSSKSKSGNEDNKKS